MKQCLGDDYFQPNDPDEMQNYSHYVPREMSVYNSLFSAELETNAHTNTYMNIQRHVMKEDL